MKIAIVGVGRVGSAIAYNIVLQGLASTLVLANRNESKAIGEAQDLRHSLAFCKHRMNIEVLTFEELDDCDLLIITASIPPQSELTSRLELAEPNVQMFRTFIPVLVRNNPQAIILVVSNPVDLLTHLTTQLSGFPSSCVMGIGTLVDSARFRVALSQMENIHPDDLRAYVLGDHGPNQFPVFSQAVVGGENIIDNPEHRALSDAVKQSGFEVMKSKGYTNYAIASATCEVIRAIAYDEHRTMPLSTCFSEWCGIKDSCFSIPVVVGAQGIIRYLHPTLNQREQEDLKHAALAIANDIRAFAL